MDLSFLVLWKIAHHDVQADLIYHIITRVICLVDTRFAGATGSMCRAYKCRGHLTECHIVRSVTVVIVVRALGRRVNFHQPLDHSLF